MSTCIQTYENQSAIVEHIIHLANGNYLKAIELIESSEETELLSENVCYLCTTKSNTA